MSLSNQIRNKIGNGENRVHNGSQSEITNLQNNLNDQLNKIK